MKIKIKYYGKATKTCLMKLRRNDKGRTIYLVEGIGGANLSLIRNKESTILYQSPDHTIEDIKSMADTYWYHEDDVTEIFETNREATELLQKDF